MYMTLEYDPYPLSAGKDGPRMPFGLGVKMNGPDGPVFASVSWDPSTPPIRVDDETYLLSTEVQVDGTSGLEPFAMQGAKLLSVISGRSTPSGPCQECGVPLEVRSVKFSRSPGTPGFALDGVPKVLHGEDPDPCRSSIHDYFNRNGLFTACSDRIGGMYAVWFDKDVSHGAVQAFLERHPWTGLGLFASTIRKDGTSLGYLFASREHMQHDLSHWRSDDRNAACE